MSLDQITKITSKSWFSRLGDAFKGLLFGLLLFIAAFPLLFWNEGRAVKTYKSLLQGEQEVVEIQHDSIQPEFDGKLVHVSGMVDTKAVLNDEVFGISVNALRLRRDVEMYQWEETSRSETRRKLGGGEETVTVYSYGKVWSGTPISSSRFQEPAGHQNPGAFPYEGLERLARPVSLGAFTLSDSLVRRISNYEPLPIAAQDFVTPAAEQPAQMDGAHPESDVAAGQTATGSSRSAFTPFAGGYYIGDNPNSPQVGDMRVSFRIVSPQIVSIVAKQTGDSFAPYETRTRPVELLQTGSHSAAEMFTKAHKDNELFTWILRLVGLVVMVIGLNMVFRPLSVVADVVPLFGRLVAAGTGIIAFLLAAMLSLITIALAWVFYRPLLGIALLVIASVLGVGVLRKMKSAKIANAAQQVHPAG